MYARTPTPTLNYKIKLHIPKYITLENISSKHTEDSECPLSKKVQHKTFQNLSGFKSSGSILLTSGGRAEQQTGAGHEQINIHPKLQGCDVNLTHMETFFDRQVKRFPGSGIYYIIWKTFPQLNDPILCKQSKCL